MVRSTGRHHAVQTGMINKTHLHGPPNPQKSPGAVWGKARYRLGQPLTQTTRCVFKQPLQTNRATIISKCKKETNETTLNQTKPNKQAIKQKPNTPSMLLQSSKTFPAPQPSSDSAAEELRIAGAAAHRSRRSRHRMHVPPSDGPALGWLQNRTGKMGGGGPSAGSVVLELLERLRAISWFSRLVRCFFTIKFHIADVY